MIEERLIEERMIEETTLNPSIDDSDLNRSWLTTKTEEDLNRTDDLGRTPLWKAVSEDGHVEEVRSMVDAGCDVNMADIYGTTPLLIATISSKLNLVEYVSILLKAGASPDPVEANSWTPLMQLIYRASDDPFKMRMFVEAIQLLIDAGCDVNRAFKPDSKFSRTPLMMALLKNLSSIVEILLDAGADPDMTNQNGAFEDGCRIVSRPLHEVAQGKNICLQIGRLLVQANCDRTITDGMDNNCPAHRGGEYPRTPLNLAIHAVNLPFLKMLLLADFDARKEGPIEVFHDCTDERNKIKELFQEKLFNPCTLQSLARSAVRGCLRGGGARQRIAALELPKHFNDKLMFWNSLTW